MPGLLEGGNQGQANAQSEGLPQTSLNSQQMAQFKQGYQLGQQLLYKDQVFGGLIKDVEEQEDNVSLLARLVVRVLEKVQEGIGKLDMVVATSIGLALLNDIALALNETGRTKVSADDVTEAFGHGVNLWLNKYGSTYDPRELQEAYRQMGGSMPESGDMPMNQPQGGAMPQGGV